MRRPIRLLVSGLAAGALLALPSTMVPAESSAGGRAARLDCDKSDGSFKVASKRVDRREPAETVGIYADIKNTTRQWRSKVRGQVCFYDAKGRLVDNGLVYADWLSVAPGQKISFYISEDAPASWHRYTLRFQSKGTGLRPVTSKVVVTTGEVAIDSFGYLEVPVSVRNDNSFPIRNVAVYVSLFDARGRIISLDTSTYVYTDPSTLGPGQVGTFTADAFASHEGVERVRIGVEAFRS